MSTGVTAKGYPYPNGDDPVSSGDDAIKALAQKLEAVAPFAIAAGVANIVAPGGTASPSVAVVFPAGRFSVPPIVIANLGVGTVNFLTNVSTPTANGVTLTMFHNTAGTAVVANTYPVHWIAIQMLPAAAPG